MKTFIAVFLTGLLMFTNALAEGEVNHRYNIQGYILDENDQGIANQEVKVYKGRLLLEIGKTDAAGLYSLKLKLHDSDNHQILRLRTGDNEAELKVTFDTDNADTLRTHQANFVDGKFIEGAITRFGIPSWIYPLAGLIFISFLAINLEKRRKKKIQQKKDKLSGRQSTGSHHARKKRRKKH